MDDKKFAREMDLKRLEREDYDKYLEVCRIVGWPTGKKNDSTKECPNCHELNSFEPGTVNYNIRDDQGNRLSKEAAEEFANYRCRCISCNNNFCIKCKKL